MTQCQNCKAQLSGPYCAQCGQKHNLNIPSVLNFLGEFTEAFTHADSRFWRTLWLLLVRPGELPKRYFAGQRAQFLPPLRLYFLITIGFFYCSLSTRAWVILMSIRHSLKLGQRRLLTLRRSSKGNRVTCSTAVQLKTICCPKYRGPASRRLTTMASHCRSALLPMCPKVCSYSCPSSLRP